MSPKLHCEKLYISSMFALHESKALCCTCCFNFVRLLSQYKIHINAICCYHEVCTSCQPFSFSTPQIFMKQGLDFNWYSPDGDLSTDSYKGFRNDAMDRRSSSYGVTIPHLHNSMQTQVIQMLLQLI